MLDLHLEHISYAGIVIALILTGAGLPVPEEVLVIVSGVASKEGILNPWLAFASCVVGALLGDLATYGIGHHFGHNVLREHPWFARFVTPEREKQIEEMIKRHGLKVFFLARFMVGLRSPMYLTAGILRVSFTRFILIDTFCATTVIGVFFSLSYVFADRINGWWHWIRDAELFITISVVTAVLGVLLFFYVRRRRRASKLKTLRDQRSEKPGDSLNGTADPDPEHDTEGHAKTKTVV
jgi:membrane protein DedA with SNARE-associated domain